MSGEVDKPARIAHRRPASRATSSSSAATASRSAPAEVGHTGIYVGNGWFVHSSGAGVTLQPLQGWYSKTFAWARRPLAEAGLPPRKAGFAAASAAEQRVRRPRLRAPPPARVGRRDRARLDTHRRTSGTVPSRVPRYRSFRELLPPRGPSARRAGRGGLAGMGSAGMRRAKLGPATVGAGGDRAGGDGGRRAALGLRSGPSLPVALGSFRRSHWRSAPPTPRRSRRGLNASDSPLRRRSHRVLRSGGPPALRRASAGGTATDRRSASSSASGSSSRCTGPSPSPALLARIRRGEIGGVILFGANIESRAQLRRLTATLQQAARDAGRPPLLIATDQEGGSVRRLPWVGPVRLARRELGRLGPPAIRARGARGRQALRARGRQRRSRARRRRARAPGSFMALEQRTFAPTPGAVAGSDGRVRRGLAAARVAAAVKHFPGIGRATRNTDRTAVAIAAGQGRARRGPTCPVPAAIAAGVPIVMLSNATYPALDAKPAPWSPSIQALLRRELGFTGVTITDALDGAAATSGPVAAVGRRARRPGRRRSAAPDRQRGVERRRLRARRRVAEQGRISPRRRCRRATTGSRRSSAPTAERPRTATGPARYPPITSSGG